LAAICLSAGVLSGCTTRDAESFIDRYQLQAKVGPLYALVAEGRTVGWLYGAVHYGTEERPSMSPAAVRAMAQTRHVYFEHTDRTGTSWAMRDAIAEDLSAAARAKRAAAMASADTIRQRLMAAKQIESQTAGVAVVLSEDRSYHEHWALANNYCGAFYEYGTERLARAFASGREITIHSLETDASRQAALDEARAPRCERKDLADAATSADTPIPATLGAICEAILRDISRDQREGRPHEGTSAAACVLDSRHRSMVERIAAAAKAGEKPFVIVGRGHLMPGQNLFALLEAHGLVARRID
jgi:uncharacterized protein YbaP (TraB family)